MIQATDKAEDLNGCDLVVEAVFENLELKHKITKELEPQVAENGVWGTNTSSLPITRLAEASNKPDNFIGIHFFSPVDKMPLVEIICGDQTNDETLARAFDFRPPDSEKRRLSLMIKSDSSLPEPLLPSFMKQRRWFQKGFIPFVSIPWARQLVCRLDH